MSNPFHNHAPTTDINTLITEEEGFDHVCLITDMPTNRSSLPSPYTMREISGYDLSSSDWGGASSVKQEEENENIKKMKN